MKIESLDPSALVRGYLDQNYRIVLWPATGNAKGPKEKGWPDKIYTFDDYRPENHRVGLLTGVEVAPGQHLHDVDLDWEPGARVASKLLPVTGFVFGRASKPLSHCIYLTSTPLPFYRYEDVDKTCLLESRGTEVSGGIGLQSMVPPSVWHKDGKSEELVFLKHANRVPSVVDAAKLRQRVCLAAIAMILSKHLGVNGFGHEPRLYFAGYFLKAGLNIEEIIEVGEAISIYCNNLEVGDVRVAVESTAARMKDPKQKIKGGPALMKIIGAHGKAVVDRINSWLGRDSDFIRDKDGVILKESQENIRRAAQLLEVELSYQSFAERMLIKHGDHKPKTMEDRELVDLWLRVDQEFRFKPSYVFFEKVISNTAYTNSFHPVRDYLRPLVWDGTPRVDRWLVNYAGAESSPYVLAVSAIVLIAAVRRVMHPGCKYDEMLVLEGGQGVYKSSALRALCPHDDWFSDDLPLNVDAKQIIERTLGKWIIEASDLAGKRKADVEQLKSTLSRQVDGPARMAYAHFPVERARQFIIIGTTNSEIYLTDSTGARRFWPVTITKFDVAGIVRDRDQIWAEAVHRESKGESIRLHESLWGSAAEHQDKRRETDAWEMGIEELLDGRGPDQTGRIRIPLSDIWAVVQPDMSRRDRVGGMRISDIMSRLGYERGTMRVDGKVIRAYLGKPASFDFSDWETRRE